jgi:beta-aspartyl-peptidase (threonine type)
MSIYTIVIHGGAGTIRKEDMNDALEKKHLEGLQEALDAGYEVLKAGGSAVDAVTASVIKLEDNVLFNAGRGSVFTKKGLQEMDAAIMDGIDLSAGAVAGVRNVRNPISLAYEVMKNSPHVFLCGGGANEFAVARNVKLEPDEYFFSQFRYDQWAKMRDSDAYSLDHADPQIEKLMKNKKFGTVGAVACDAHGNVAAATSTGGMTNKAFGRVGDTPVIGCGNYANNNTCAISCTGHGEVFIKAVAAYDVSCLMEYKGKSLQEALEIVVHKKLKHMEGEGGIIGVDPQGRGAMVFNSEGMYRGIRDANGLNEVAIYGQ